MPARRRWPRHSITYLINWREPALQFAIDVVTQLVQNVRRKPGHGEMWALVEDAVGEGRDIRGYTFYHQQDTEHAVEGYGLWLAWGSAEAGEIALASVGEEIVAALRDEGLDVSWDGNTKKRISVSIDWKRRRD